MIQINVTKLKEQIKVHGVKSVKAHYLSNGMYGWEFDWWLAQVMGQVGTLSRWRIAQN